MKIAVLNNSGNVGKSTICENLLQPRILDSKIIKVETINSDGTNDQTYSADDFIKITNSLDEYDNAIIDIGASNVEKMFTQFNKYYGSHEDFDYFIIPLVPDNKQQEDTITTILELLTLGVDNDRIKVIFNRCKRDLLIEKHYPVFMKSNVAKNLNINKDNAVIIQETEMFDLLKSIDKTMSTIVDDQRDFKLLLKESNSKEERSTLSTERAIKRLVTGVNNEFNLAFNKLSLEN